VTVGRFLLAAIAGACAVWILIFFGATFDPAYDGAGAIYWDGVVYGEFRAGYLAMLYVPPVLMVVCIYFAFRGRSQGN
jgi:hypothetical protein